MHHPDKRTVTGALQNVSITDRSEPSEVTLAEITKNQDRRRKAAYKWYKHNAKPTKEQMCRILNFSNDTDISLEDVDLLPWNLKDTKVIKESMKSSKKEKTEKKEKKEKKMDKKEKKDKREKEVDFSNDPALEDADILPWKAVKETGEFEISSVISEKLRKLEVEEQLNRKKAERRRKREEAKKKSMLLVNVQDISTAEEDRLESVFRWYVRMGMPSREDFSGQIAIQRVDITPEDVDLLTWNTIGSRVVNMGTMNAIIRNKALKG
jgi:hypothetical protein